MLEEEPNPDYRVLVMLGMDGPWCILPRLCVRMLYGVIIKLRENLKKRTSIRNNLRQI